MTWWQVILWAMGGVAALWCVLKVAADAIFGTYFDKKLRFVGRIAGVVGAAADKFAKEVKKNENS